MDAADVTGAWMPGSCGSRVKISPGQHAAMHRRAYLGIHSRLPVDGWDAASAVCHAGSVKAVSRAVVARNAEQEGHFDPILCRWACHHFAATATIICTPQEYIARLFVLDVVQVTQAFSDTNLIISGATAASLALGRFVLLPIQRKFNAKAGLPTQNGIPHAEAGDRWGPWLLACHGPVSGILCGILYLAVGFLALSMRQKQRQCFVGCIRSVLQTVKPCFSHRLAQEASWLLKSNDPANFTLVDVFAWWVLSTMGVHVHLARP